jgi:beta-N-acetylhexosaminidase
LRPPHWRAYPPAEIFVNLSAHSQESAIRACYLNARLIAHDLSALGINTNCAPVADLRLQGAHDIIGDRAFGGTAHDIVPLARAQAQGLMDGGVIPVLKHIPGHGRAMVDSHHDLPIVAESLEVLDQSDFEPFRQLADLPMGMTAHIRYSAIDEAQPATLSPRAISLIREQIGFGGLLMSDDISMKALNGDLSELTAAALAAGCDVVLHCNGDMDEMQRVAKGARELDIAGQERAQRAFHAIGFAATTDVAAIETELASLLPQSAAA